MTVMNCSRCNTSSLDLDDRGYCTSCQSWVDGPPKPPTPMCDRVRAVQDKSQALGAFLEWLAQNGIVLAAYQRVHGGLSEDDLQLHHESIESLLARYFEIDLEAVEAEKRAMLDALRKDPRRA